MNTIKNKLRSLYALRAGLRIATTTALLAYPLGCVAFLILPNHLEYVGGILLALACVGFAYTLPSYIHRVGIMPQVLCLIDPTGQLDELESELRRRAQAFSYRVFSAIIVAGVFYMVVSSDMARDNVPGGWWMPTVDDHWLAILFGVVFYVLLLPLLFLAWKLPNPVLEE